MLSTPKRLLTNKQVVVAVADQDLASLILSFKYRLRPTRLQHTALNAICESQRQLYNGSLEHRLGAYRKAKRRVTLYDQMAELTDLRQMPEFAAFPLNLQRWTLRRLDAAYQAFFRRVKAKGDKAGFPRFRSRSRWRSFGFCHSDGLQIHLGCLCFKSLPGSLRIHLHRPLPEGKPVSCTFTRDAKGWYVCLQYRVPVQPLAATGLQVGIDVGLTTLAMLSIGEAVANPRHAKRAERELRRRQRALTRCQRGSKRRRKAKARVAQLYARVANARQTYLHQVSARLVRDYDLIAVERLNVRGLASGILAKSVQDAGWSTLNGMLAYKAERAGRELIEVKAAGTSQTCPECGQVRKKSLAERVHRCDCGCVMDRDHAAAVVVLQRAVAMSVASQREAVACA